MIGRRAAPSIRKEPRTEDFFVLLAESSLSGAFLIQDELFRYVNPAFAALFGYGVEEILEKLGPTELTAPEDRELISKILKSRPDDKIFDETLSIQGVGKDGRLLHLHIKLSPTIYREAAALIGTVVDRTDEAASEQKLARQRGEDISASYAIDHDGTIIECNDSFAQLFAFPSVNAVIGSNIVSIFPTPRLKDSFLQLVTEKRRIDHYRSEYVRRDGTRVYVIENVYGDFDLNGNLKGIRGYLVDDTEKRKLEGQLYQSQRLENLGTLVGGIAHDFNNVLAIIAGHASVITKARYDLERFEASVDAIKKAAKRGAHMVRQLLTFARKVELVTESVKIDDTINEIVTLCRETFNEKITFELDVAKEIPSIHADPNQLHQVLLNLCVNARDAMPAGGTLTISASRVNREHVSASFADVEAQEYVMLKVADTGTGMSGEVLGHIFEPFFTTKKKGEGTGLGLSVVYGIIKSHHGFIDVRSAIKKGSTFTVYLPIPSQVIEEIAAPSESVELIKGSGQTILVVEDEASLREFVESTLKDNGYNVLVAADGVEAAQKYARNQDKIDLILLDMGLPGMNGTELLSVIKRLDPDVKVVAASGYLEPEIKTDIFNEGAVGFLSKPYMVHELLGTINRAFSLQRS